jgi:hypothetical protein
MEFPANISRKYSDGQNFQSFPRMFHDFRSFSEFHLDCPIFSLFFISWLVRTLVKERPSTEEGSIARIWARARALGLSGAFGHWFIQCFLAQVVSFLFCNTFGAHNMYIHISYIVKTINQCRALCHFCGTGFTTRDIKRLMAVGSILNVPSSIVSFYWSSGNLKNEFIFHPNCGKPSE